MPKMQGEPAAPKPLAKAGRGRLNVGMIRGVAAALLVASGALAQAPTDPFPNPIPAAEGVIRVERH